MSGTLFSLIALVLGFSALLIWVYSPSRKQELNDTAHLVFDDAGQAGDIRTRMENRDE